MSEKEEKPKSSRPKPEPEAVYTKREMLAAAATFGVSPDVLAGALRSLDKERLTRSEVTKAIQQFKERKV